MIRWGGKSFRPRRPQRRKPDINDLMKPLGEKQFKGNVWGSQIMNVQKDGITPPPVETFHITAEDGSPLLTEGGDFIDFEFVPPPTTDPDYQAVLDYATTQGYTLPSASGQTLQDQFVKDLKSAGIWSELDILYVMATDGDGSYSKLNFINPSSHYLLENGSMTFVSNEGFDRTTGSYLRTQYIPSTDAVNATLNDTSNFLWDFDNTLTSSRDTYMGTILNNQRDRFNTQLTPNVGYAVNQLGTTFTNSTLGIGFKMIQRTTGGTINIFNQVSTPTDTFAGTPDVGSLNTAELVIGRDGGGAGNLSNMTISIFGRGSSLVGKENDLLTAITTYMNGL